MEEDREEEDNKEKYIEEKRRPTKVTQKDIKLPTKQHYKNKVTKKREKKRRWK